MQHNRRAKPAGRESGFHLHGALRPEGVRTVIPQLSSAHFSAATLPPQRASGPPLRECWSCPQRRWSSKINLANVLRPNGLFCPSHRGDADPDGNKPSVWRRHRTSRGRRSRCHCSANAGSGTGGWSVAGPASVCFLADEVVIAAFSPMSLRRADPRRRQDPEA